MSENWPNYATWGDLFAVGRNLPSLPSFLLPLALYMIPIYSRAAIKEKRAAGYDKQVASNSSINVHYLQKNVRRILCTR